MTSQWYGWLRDQLYVPELVLLGTAGLAGGFLLTRRTIVADVRARRNGLTAQVERLTRTRAEAVNSAAAELRRLERDLHDGAQARLVALGVNLRTAEKLIDTSPGDGEGASGRLPGGRRRRPCRSYAASSAESTRQCSPTEAWATRSRRSRWTAQSSR